MIGLAIATLALGNVQSSGESFAQNARCLPVFTLMGWDTQQGQAQQRPAPRAEAPPSAQRPRRDERPRVRPCLHLANG